MILRKGTISRSFYDISDIETMSPGWSRNGTFGTCVPLGSQGERFPDSV